MKVLSNMQLNIRMPWKCMMWERSGENNVNATSVIDNKCHRHMFTEINKFHTSSTCFKLTHPNAYVSNDAYVSYVAFVLQFMFFTI